jgi:hypothetical protein
MIISEFSFVITNCFMQIIKFYAIKNILYFFKLLYMPYYYTIYIKSISLLFFNYQ